MSGPAWNTLLRQFRSVVGPPDGGLTDAQLLSRWLASRDEAAFELLVWRHGPTVRGVCRRLLRRPQDVEDAFQATLLVFIRKAGSIGKREAVASWLYKVAYRVALQARARPAPEQLLDGRDVLVPSPPTADAVAWRDVRRVLDEEVNRLPGRYRTVFVLRYLQGKTDEQAARELGVPTGTVQSRLSRARDRLRSRLTRRGVALTAGALAAGCAAEASAALPAPLVISTVKAALSGAAGQAAAAGVVTAQAAALAKGALHAMWMTKVKMTAAVVLSVALLGGGAFTYRSVAAGPGDEPGQVGRTEQPAGQGKAKDKPDDRASDELKKLKAENQRLKGMLEEANVRERELSAKNEADIASLTTRLKQVEADLTKLSRGAGSRDKLLPPPAADTVRDLPQQDPRTGQLLAPPSRGAESNKVPPDTIPLATAEAAKDAVEVVQAQVQVKKAELQGAMVELKAAQRALGRVKELSKTGAISSEEINAAEDKVGKAQAAVQVKEAELNEQEIRLRQAKRRLDQLQPAKPASGVAAPAADPQQLQDIRKELERLMQKLESLEKGGKPPAPDAPRRQ